MTRTLQLCAPWVAQSVALDTFAMGPSIKYATLEKEGVREGVTVCYRRGGQEHVTSHLEFFIIHMKHEI